MNILVCGASGLIGSAICARLSRDGHHVIRGVRRPAQTGELTMDYTTDVLPAHWLPRLADVDAVVNAVGILTERGTQRFDTIHRQAPIALFTACCQAGVRQVIQVSALGAQRGGTAYFDSKYVADTCLLALPLNARIVRPALVYGAAGTSARWFRMLASLPVHVLPAGGRQPLRPVHADDLAEVVARLLSARPAPGRPCIEVVGAARVSYREMLSIYRAGMGFAPALPVSIPKTLVDASAWLLDRVPGSLLTRATWSMLQAGSTGDDGATSALLGRAPAGISSFIGPDTAAAARQEALAAWRPAALRAALAIVWIWTAIVSAFLYPPADSLALLQRVPLRGAAAWIALYCASALDLALGLATWFRPGRRLWAAQAALILAYSAIIAFAMPEMLLHPFGPLLKNIPMLAILLLLFSEEPRP